MATQTVILGRLSDQDGLSITLSYDYDDVTLLMSAIRIDNKSSRGLSVSAARTDGSKTYSITAPAGQLTSFNINANSAERLQLSTTSFGALDGVEWHAVML